VRDFVYITDSTYTREEVLSMELEVLRVLEFNLTTPSSYRFLELYSKSVALTPPDFALATYLLELATIEYKILRYTPSLLASSAIYLTNKIRGRTSSHM
jgi:cyclin B